MGHDQPISKGGNTGTAGAKSDENAIRDDGINDAHDLPRYSETEPSTYQKEINTQQFTTRTSGEGPRYLNYDHADGNDTAPELGDEARLVSSIQDITTDFFTAIREGNHALISSLLSTGLVTVSTTTRDGLTPLLAAIETGHIATARLLLEHGADANEYGTIGRGPKTSRATAPRIQRTPLQLAAARGNLPIVKLLMETYSADDALIAPDGELALRLAAAGAHREVVAYLPARRGGGVKRWRAKHAAAMERARRAAQGVGRVAVFVAWTLPRFFVWTVPKHVLVLPIVKRIKWLHAHRAELPRVVADAVRRCWGALRRLPGDVWDVLRRVPRFLRELAELVGEAVVATVKGAPKAAAIAALWVWNGGKTFVAVIGRVLGRLFSFLHTVAVAVGTFFRNVTLKNVWDGFVAFVRAVVVDGPRRLWLWMRKLGDVGLKMLSAMWGCFGRLLGELVVLLGKAVTYIPRKLWEILASVFKSVGYGGKEIMIWIDPKR